MDGGHKATQPTEHSPLMEPEDGCGWATSTLVKLVLQDMVWLVEVSGNGGEE